MEIKDSGKTSSPMPPFSCVCVCSWKCLCVFAHGCLSVCICHRWGFVYGEARVCLKGCLHCLALAIDFLRWCHWNSRKSVCSPVEGILSIWKEYCPHHQPCSILDPLFSKPTHNRWPVGSTAFSHLRVFLLFLSEYSWHTMLHYFRCAA